MKNPFFMANQWWFFSYGSLIELQQTVSIFWVDKNSNEIKKDRNFFCFKHMKNCKLYCHQINSDEMKKMFICEILIIDFQLVDPANFVFSYKLIAQITSLHLK